MRYLFLLLLISFFSISCSDSSNSDPTDKVCVVVDDCLDGYNCINNVCVKIADECTQNSECPDGFECLLNKCSEKAPICNLNSDCPQGYRCSLNGECEIFACSNDNQCGAKEICENGSCISGCNNSSQCSQGEVCNTTTKKCEAGFDCRLDGCQEQGYQCSHSTGVCEPTLWCNTSADCIPSEHCNPMSGQCEPNEDSCETDNDCQDGYRCRSSVCTAIGGCLSNSDCVESEKPICNVSSGVCYQCLSDSDCSNGDGCDLQNHTCGGGSTGECMADSDCGLNRRCNLNTTPHSCESIFGNECSVDSDCPADQSCFINSNPKRCVECLADSQCAEGQVCNANTHMCEFAGSGVSCETDMDCDIYAGESCINNVCVNPNGGATGDGICDSTLGMLLCLILEGYCSDSGDCLFE